MTDTVKKKKTQMQELKEIALELKRKSDINVVRFSDIKNTYARRKDVPPSSLLIKDGTWLTLGKQLTNAGHYCHRITNRFWNDFSHLGSDEEVVAELADVDPLGLGDYIPRQGKHHNLPAGLRFPNGAHDPLLTMREGTNRKIVDGHITGYIEGVRRRDEKGLALETEVKAVERLGALKALTD